MPQMAKKKVDDDGRHIVVACFRSKKSHSIVKNYSIYQILHFQHGEDTGKS